MLRFKLCIQMQEAKFLSIIKVYRLFAIPSILHLLTLTFRNVFYVFSLKIKTKTHKFARSVYFITFADLNYKRLDFLWRKGLWNILSTLLWMTQKI